MASPEKDLNERTIERLLTEMREPNQQTARDHDRFRLAQGNKPNTRRIIVQWLLKLDDHLQGRTFGSVTPNDVTAFLAFLRQAGYSDDSVVGAAINLRAFVRWTLRVKELPPAFEEVFRLDRRSDLPQRPVLHPDAFASFMKALPKLMDQAFAAVLWETGFRISEALSLYVGSVEFDDKGGAWLQMPKDGYGLKTGPRRVYIALHAPLLRAWMQTHPRRNDPRAPLWLGDSPRNKGRAIRKFYVVSRWRLAFRVSGVTPFNPHLLRHTAATRDAEAGFNELDLCAKYGWSPGSKMPSHYVRQRRAHQENMARRSVGVGADGLPAPVYRTNPEEKPCPFCAEPIRAAAAKCKHCHEFLSTSRAAGARNADGFPSRERD